MEEYSIIGGDGQEYGPVPALTIREWVQQGRANGQTMTKRGSEAPRPLMELQEFSDMFGTKGSGPAKAASGPIKLGKPMATGASPQAAAGMPQVAGTPFPQAAGSGFLGGASTSTGGGQEELVMQLSEPLSKTSFWLKFMAVFQFISGAWAALTIFGIIYAWLPIWMGVLMWQAANRSREAAMSGDLGSALVAQNKIKLLILIMGITTLISLLLAAAFIAFFFIVGVSSGPGLLEQLQQLEQGAY